ncbi:TatD family hydrolase [Candidatus Nitrosotenuis uzonensis]|uniref:Putative TatD related DNase n=1 Tax=Candidatus Nitrosotenuis uzonensis TaxID=1407055 RepID=A0A812F6Y7_9ARCH|nr:TatD family hydrolase [Candidatus Nitrosotenuis uzonensis]MCA2003366.1 TatD family hydrolase [Candidatus Nitrosotenuis sp.]CAE6495296.1 putative TatD related DNase [Candidatus Nitrosotenuis uzonensis]
MAFILDAHIHLSDPLYAEHIDLIVNSMESTGIKACAVSMDNKSSQMTLKLAEKSKNILPFVGIHPEKASDDLDTMVSLINKNSQISGIGEIGLDRSYCSDDDQFKRQVTVFKKLLEQAETLRKPVSVHSRKTLDDIFEIIPSYNISGFLLHWFDGSKKQLKQAMDLGCYVSYGPVMVYSQDKQVLASLSNRDRILVETDGPVKFSHCFGRKEAQITFIPSVVFALAKLLEQSYDETVSMLQNNSERYLGLTR